MTSLACPDCDSSEPRHLDINKESLVNYYMCTACGHLWTADKDSHTVVEHVTRLRRVPDPLQPGKDWPQD